MEKRINKIKRIADANFNRAREGLRVVEDIARFVLDNESLSQSIKDMRSKIAYIQKDYKEFILFRDTADDVGVNVDSLIENNRSSLQDIAEANMKRSQEAFRVLEELFKIISIDISLKFKNLRYESYIIEKEIIESLKG